ncbi:unnamed protein product, partial [Effrenium voratum]
RGTLVVVVVSVALWALLMLAWRPEIFESGASQEVPRWVPRKARAIQLPSWNHSDGMDRDLSRVHLDVSFASEDVSGNASESNATEANATEGRRARKGRRESQRIGH